MLLLFITMSAQEFVLIPKENYVKDQPKALEIVDDPTLSEKAHHLTLLQRQPLVIRRRMKKPMQNQKQMRQKIKKRSIVCKQEFYNQYQC